MEKHNLQVQANQITKDIQALHAVNSTNGEISNENKEQDNHLESQKYEEHCAFVEQVSFLSIVILL